MRLRATRVLVIVLLLIVLPAVGPGWAAAQSSATARQSNAEVAVEPVLAAWFDTLPSAPAFIGLARLSFPPGGTAAGGRLGGPRLILMETGTVTVHVYDAATVVRRPPGHTPPVVEVVQADTEVALRPGDHLILTANAPREIRNDSSRPAIFLDLVIFPVAPSQLWPFTTPTGVVFQPLAVGTAEELPPAPVQLLLERVTIPPAGDDLSLPEQSGPRVLFVESGTLGLATVEGVVVYTRAAAASPGSVPGPGRPIVPGSEAVLTAGASSFVQAGAVGEAHNLGRNEVVLLTLAIVPARHDEVSSSDIGIDATNRP